jgi:2-C-methyl-D-erythritol 4-phosphate cytidylyltransferase / 2-C-methyl-D-erythritol 2,4-cyclodiphosphate synthase
VTTASGPVWSIVVAAGSGSRFGGAKQWEQLEGRSLVDWALDTCRACSDGVVLVVPAGTEGSTSAEVDAVVSGGDTRSESVRRGLTAVPESAEVVVVHDAARPRASADLMASVIGAVRQGADAAVPGLEPADTIKVVDGFGRVTATPVRSTLRAVQTPQAFRAGVLRSAHAGGGEATDDAALVEETGGEVVVVAGEVGNDKVTTTPDLERMRVSTGTRGGLRIGHGFDVHAWSNEPRPLVLGGVVIDEARGLAGHSDADAVCHALCDAILGPAGLGDLGRHFPDDDPQWAGAASTGLLAEVVRLAAAAGWRPTSADVTVVAEAPKLAPHVELMQSRLGELVGVPVTVKATRAESLGALGRGEGIAAWAVALLESVASA